MNKHNRSSLFFAGALSLAVVVSATLFATPRAPASPLAGRQLPPLSAPVPKFAPAPGLLAPLPALSKAELLKSLERSVANAQLGYSLALYTGGPTSAAARYFEGREEAFATALDLARQLPEPTAATLR